MDGEHSMSEIVEGTKPKKNAKKEVLEWILVIFIALICALIINKFLLEFTMVDGQSMENTLHHEERLIVYKLGYRFSPPKQGDIIVFTQSKGPISFLPFGEINYVKRVIGVPGQMIDIKEDHVYVDGKKLIEPHINQPTRIKMWENMTFPIKVEKDTVFVLGDNREHSSDSRFKSVGLVKYENIKGKVVFRFWPLNKISVLGQ